MSAMLVTRPDPKRLVLTLEVSNGHKSGLAFSRATRPRLRICRKLG